MKKVRNHTCTWCVFICLRVWLTFPRSYGPRFWRRIAASFFIPSFDFKQVGRGTLKDKLLMIDIWICNICNTPLHVIRSWTLLLVMNRVEKDWAAIWWWPFPLDSHVTSWNFCFSINYSGCIRAVWNTRENVVNLNSYIFIFFLTINWALLV